MIRSIGNHTFRATGITAYLKNKGSLEAAQHIANHESPRATKLYDRRAKAISLDEVLAGTAPTYIKFDIEGSEPMRSKGLARPWRLVDPRWRCVLITPRIIYGPFHSIE